MTGLLDLVRGAKRPERTVELCLRGDLVGRFEDLERQLVEADTRDTDSFGGSGESTTVAAEIEALREEMRAGSVVFRVRALGTLRSGTLMMEHPPREDNERDQRLGYNPDTFYRALIRECCYAIERDGETLPLRTDDGEPTDAMSEDDWTNLFDALSHQQFDTLFGAAWLLDHGDISVPTSPLASLISQRNGESSKQHSAGQARARNGSAAGSRRGSRPTNTTSKDDSPAQ